MPLRLNVGFAKKVGQPHYGSIGASCNVEVEVIADLLQNDVGDFHERVSQAFSACRQAVTDELARHRSTQASPTGSRRRPIDAHVAGTRVPRSRPTQAKATASSGRASTGQNEPIRQLARQIGGLGVRKLDRLAQKMFSKPLVDLTGMEASALIDTLRAIKAGEIEVHHTLSGGLA